MANYIKIVSFTKGYQGIQIQGSQAWAERDPLTYSMNSHYWLSLGTPLGTGWKYKSGPCPQRAHSII